MTKGLGYRNQVQGRMQKSKSVKHQNTVKTEAQKTFGESQLRPLYSGSHCCYPFSLPLPNSQNMPILLIKHFFQKEKVTGNVQLDQKKKRQQKFDFHTSKISDHLKTHQNAWAKRKGSQWFKINRALFLQIELATVCVCVCLYLSDKK